jgi:hypothetical protein
MAVIRFARRASQMIPHGLERAGGSSMTLISSYQLGKYHISSDVNESTIKESSACHGFARMTQ